MSIPAKRSIIDFDRKYDRFESEYKKTLRLEDKLSIINEAQEIYFENRVDVAETNSAVRNDIRKFERKKVLLEEFDKQENCDIYKLPNEMFRLLRHTAKIKKEGCPVKEVPIIIYQMDDIDRARKNSFWKSSYYWEHVLADEGENGLYLYHDCEFEIISVNVDYYRKPKEIHAPSMTERGNYVDWNGVKREKDQDCEFYQTYQFRKIMNISVLIARAEGGDFPDYQTKLREVLQDENLNF